MTVLILSQYYIKSDSSLTTFLIIRSVIFITCKAANLKVRVGLKDVL